VGGVMAKLTNLQQAFIDQYFLCNMNGTEAVIQAGYAVKNRQTAAAIASENLRKPHIRAEIDRRLEENTISANHVLYILTQHALGDVRHVIDKNGIPSMSMAIKNNATHMIKRWKRKKTTSEHSTTEEYEVELHDPQAAAVHLGRHYKLFTDKFEVTDWRAEFANAGINPDDELEAVTAEFIARLEKGG
jgi:hypothetical protein